MWHPATTFPTRGSFGRGYDLRRSVLGMNVIQRQTTLASAADRLSLHRRTDRGQCACAALRFATGVDGFYTRQGQCSTGRGDLDDHAALNLVKCLSSSRHVRCRRHHRFRHRYRSKLDRPRDRSSSPPCGLYRPVRRCNPPLAGAAFTSPFGGEQRNDYDAALRGIRSSSAAYESFVQRTEVEPGRGGLRRFDR